MRFLRLLFPIYFRRLRWEIAGWWLLSGILSMLFLSGRELERLYGLSQAEVIVALWMILRLALIDDAFGTLAGRHWRPVKGREILAARLLLVLLVFLPPLLLRFVAWQRWAAPDAGKWRGYLLDAGGSLGGLLLAGLAIQLVATLNRWVLKRGRKTAAVAIAVLAGWWLMRTGMVSMWTGRMGFYGYEGYSPSERFDRDDAVGGILALLPKDPLLLGSWRSYGNRNSYLPMREILRLPLREGRIAIEPGVEAVIKKPELSGWDLGFEVRFRCRDRETARKYQATISVVRFRDGHYSDVNASQGQTFVSLVPLAPLREVFIKATAITPAVLPWRDAGKDAGTENAELIFYARDHSLPPVAIPPVPWIREVRQGDPPRLPAIYRKWGNRGSQEGNFDMYFVVPDEPWASAEDKIRACLMMAGSYKETDQAVAETALGMGRAAIPALLAQPTWSDPAWEQIVRPLLLAHVTVEDRPSLLERLKTETRLSAIFLAKGWAADTLPVLRDKAADGLPLDVNSLKILAGAKEAGLAGDLKRVALRSNVGSEELDALLKDYPGFDWQGYALESWRMRKHRSLQLDQSRLPAIRAARAGDASAFRHLAEQAQMEESGYEEDLRKLVAGEPQDVIAQVKENFAAMRFDPASGTWAAR